jgi:hypothetical protein
MLKAKAFFDQIINIPAPASGNTAGSSSRPPRIIYVRDFTILSASSSAWYPGLLAAVRSRRTSALSRQSAPVLSPTTVVFGITPSVVQRPASSPPSSAGMLSYLNSKQGISTLRSPPKAGKPDTSDDEAEKARERRLKDRLRKWERGDSTLQDELPPLYTGGEAEESSERSGNVFVMGGEEPNAMTGGLPSILAQLARLSGRSSPTESDRPTKFYRSSFIVPSVRSLLREKACRMDRRREINELTMRMGIASDGGVLAPLDPRLGDVENSEQGKEPDVRASQMWETWGRELELWTNIRKIADRVVGKAIATISQVSLGSARNTLDPVPVEWSDVYEAWAAHKATWDHRKAWVQHALPKSGLEQEQGEPSQEGEAAVDEVIEAVKQDPDLNEHETKLLRCIVNSGEESPPFW